MNSSPIWNYYEKVQGKVPGARMAKCMLCEKEYSYATSITNLKKHLNFKHRTTYNLLPNAKVTEETIQYETEIEHKQEDSSTHHDDDSDPLEEYLEEVSDSKEGTSVSIIEIHEDKVGVNRQNSVPFMGFKPKAKKKVHVPTKHHSINGLENTEPKRLRLATDDDDDLDNFGKYVVSTLRTLRFELCIHAQDEIQSLLSKYKMKNRS